MQKTYWWRVVVLLLSVGLVLLGWVYETYFCFSGGNPECLLDQFRLTIFEPLFIFSISLFTTSLLLFFINDIIFKKWLRFALIWFVVTFIFVALAPVYTGGWMSFGPTKESVSIWMGSLFVILSLGKIVWDSKKQNKVF